MDEVYDYNESMEERDQRIKNHSLFLSKIKDQPYDQTYLKLKERDSLLQIREKEDIVFKTKSKLKKSIFTQSNIRQSKIYSNLPKEKQVDSFIESLNILCLEQIDDVLKKQIILENLSQIQENEEKKVQYLNVIQELEHLSQIFIFDIEQVKLKYLQQFINLDNLKVRLIEEYYEDPLNQDKELLGLSKIQLSEDKQKSQENNKIDDLNNLFKLIGILIELINQEKLKEQGLEVENKEKKDSEEEEKIKNNLKELETFLQISLEILKELLKENGGLQEQLKKLEEDYKEDQKKKQQQEDEELKKIEQQIFELEQQESFQINELKDRFEIDLGVVSQLYRFVGKDETEKLLKIAIGVCHGDKRQAVNILIANPLELVEFDRLDEVQKSVMQQVGLNSIKAHREVYDQVVIRFQNLGYKQQDLDRVLQFIRDEAQIIVHFKLHDIIQFLAKKEGGHLKNLFEVNQSNGNSNKQNRKSWETNIFGGIYDLYKKEEEDKKRPKYGVFNIFNNPKGVKSCSQYGLSYFVLKNTRLRTTFTYRDSSDLSKDSKNSYKHVSTCQYYGHNLSQLKDQEIQNLVSISQQVLINKSQVYPEQIGTYKEVQIHGEVLFSQHVEELHYSKSELQEPVKFSPQKLNKLNKHSPKQKTNQQYLDKFIKKFPQIKIIKIDD